jgi:hypothetical protein
MDEGAQAAPPAGGDQQQTAELPLTLFGGQPPKEGQPLTLKVVAVSQDSVTVAMAADEPEPAGGTDGMADEFGKDKMQKGAM